MSCENMKINQIIYRRGQCAEDKINHQVIVSGDHGFQFGQHSFSPLFHIGIILPQF